MKKLKLITVVFLGFILSGINAFSQDVVSQTDQNLSAITKAQTSGDTNFLLTGYAYSGYSKDGANQGTFGPLGFSPIFLWKKSDKLFVEAEMEFGLEDGEISLGLEYLTLHYILNKYMTIGAGKFLSPFGTFAERLHPAWINKFSDKPLGFSDEGTMVGPMGELGVELRGGAQLGNSKINYVGYVTNGPNLATEDPAIAGQLMYKNLADNNNNKAIGGRLGFLPFSNSSLEVGVSGQTSIVGDKESDYENVGAKLFSADVSYVHKVSIFNMDIKGQLNNVAVDKANYTDESGTSYTFDNNTKAYYLQLALRPAFVQSKFIRNLEFAGRYSALNNPEGAIWSGNQKQIGFGVNYWLNWNSVLKIDYLSNKLDNEASEGSLFVQ
ncbi:MAG: hypothetical protein WAO52_03415, partial [Prolixibacteraceae bacterium]